MPPLTELEIEALGALHGVFGLLSTRTRLALFNCRIAQIAAIQNDYY